MVQRTILFLCELLVIGSPKKPSRLGFLDLCRTCCDNKIPRLRNSGSLTVTIQKASNACHPEARREGRLRTQPSFCYLARCEDQDFNIVSSRRSSRATIAAMPAPKPIRPHEHSPLEFCGETAY